MMKVDYITKPFNQLSIKTIKQLSKLTFGEYYGMMSDIRLYQQYKKTNSKYTSTWTAVIAKCNDKPIGWGLIRKNKNSSYIMFYVQYRFRRKGIGSELFSRSTRYLKRRKTKTTTIFPHDTTSINFFDRVAKKRQTNRRLIYDNTSKIIL